MSDSNNALEQEGLKYQFSPEWMQQQVREYALNANKQATHDFQRMLVDQAAKFYAKKLDISIMTAQKAVEELLPRNDKPLDLEENVKRCMAAVRMMSPKLHGLELREQENLMLLKSVHEKIDPQLKNEKIIEEKLGLIANKLNNYYSIPKPLFLLNKVWNKIKCWLSN